MKILLREFLIMKSRVQRDALSMEVTYFREDLCAPPSYKYLNQSLSHNERASLYIPKKGSLTVEAALILPFFLMILIAFFSFFSQYASAAELKIKAAAEAKKAGIAMAGMGQENSADVTIYKVKKAEEFWINPFKKEKQIIQKAVCRRWIGFTKLQNEEVYVYITPEGSVYHLYGDCTHLTLSIKSVSVVTAKNSKNDYGQKYRRCGHCDAAYGAIVYITSEGECYHSERTCSGLKRTVRQVPMSDVQGRSVCLRCLSREE